MWRIRGWIIVDNPLVSLIPPWYNPTYILQGGGGVKLKHPLIKIYGKMNKKFGSREDSDVSGFFVFSQIRKLGYFKLGKSWWVPTRFRNSRKATVKIWRNPWSKNCILRHKNTHCIRIKDSADHTRNHQQKHWQDLNKS